MRSRHESPFNEQDWSFVNVQSPLGQVRLARKLPTLAPGRTAIRRSVPSNPPGSTTKPARYRRLS